MLLFGENEDLGPRKMYGRAENSILKSMRGQIKVIHLLYILMKYCIILHGYIIILMDTHTKTKLLFYMKKINKNEAKSVIR